MPLFGKSPKAPADIVKSLRDAVTLLEKGDGKKSDKIQEDIGKGLSAMKSVLIGGADGEPSTEHVAQLAQEAYSQNLLPLLVTNLHRFDFEGKKEVASIFNNILRRQIGTRSPTVEYLSNRSEIIIHLIKGYENAEVALNCGSMLRECVRHETLARIVLYSTEFYDFFKYVEDYNFDIATDAFSTFKEVLIKHKSLSAEFLEKNYDTFYEAYLKLLNSENYVTKRQSLKLLGELLLDRHNFTVMTRYISNHCLMFQLLGELLLDRHNFTVMTRYISNHCLMFQLLGELLLDRHNFTVMTRYISNHCLMFQLLGELLLDRHNFTVMTRYISNHCLMFQLLGELLLDRHNFTVMTRYISNHCLMFQLLGELLLDRHNFTVMTRYISNHCLMFQLLGELLLDRHNFTVMTRYISNHCLMFQLLGELLLDRHNFTVMTRYISNHCLMFQLLGELLLDRHNFTVMTRYISNHCLMFQLLGELLLDRHNFTVMTRYISNPENLKLMMNLLKCKSRSIQFEAFHVFKIFVANPNKPKPILDILIRNREKLVEFLTKFQTERTEDEQFNDEKVYLIKQIQEMKAAA